MYGIKIFKHFEEYIVAIVRFCVFRNCHYIALKINDLSCDANLILSKLKQQESLSVEGQPSAYQI